MMKWIRQHITPRIKWLMLLFRTPPRLKMPDQVRNATAKCDSDMRQRESDKAKNTQETIRRFPSTN